MCEDKPKNFNDSWSLIYKTTFRNISREAESENASLVVQGMLMDFECRFSERKGWRIIFDVSLYLAGAHIFGIHGNSKEPL